MATIEQIKPTPLNIPGKILFRWNYIKNQLPRGYPFDFDQYKLPSKEAKDSLRNLGRAVEKGEKGRDLLDEAREGLARDIQEGINLVVTGKENLQSLPKDKRVPLVIAFTHPNTGLCQGNWVHLKGFEAVADNIYQGQERSYPVLLGNNRSYVDKMTHFFKKPSIQENHPYLAQLGQKVTGAVDGTAKQILVNVAHAGGCILEGQNLRIGAAMRRGNVLGVFPSVHAEATFSRVDIRVAQLLGVLGKTYGAVVVPAAASFNPIKRLYNINFGWPVQYCWDKDDPRAGESARFIAKDLEARLKFFTS